MSHDRTGASIRDCRLLIVDDDAVNRLYIEGILRKHGFINVRLAVDGSDALTQIEKEAPDLLLLDIVMPGLDGLEVCARLRGDARFADLPILFQTGLDNAADRAKAFKCGATDLVSKPINAAELVARATLHLERRRLIADLSRYRLRTEEELSVAQEMQQALLPSADLLASMFARYGIDVAGRITPCSEIGGDLWGLVPIDDVRFAVYALDFSGHGVGAALNTFRTHALIADLRDLAASPSEFLSALNKRLSSVLTPGQFATMFYGVVNTEDGQIAYAAAGTPAPVLAGGSGSSASLLDGRGLPLGIAEDMDYPQRLAALPPGASILLVSDGLLNQGSAPGAGYSDEELCALAERCVREPTASAATSAVLDDFARTQRAAVADDLTVVCLRR